ELLLSRSCVSKHTTYTLSQPSVCHPAYPTILSVTSHSVKHVPGTHRRTYTYMEHLAHDDADVASDESGVRRGVPPSDDGPSRPQAADFVPAQSWGFFKLNVFSFYFRRKSCFGDLLPGGDHPSASRCLEVASRKPAVRRYYSCAGRGRCLLTSSIS
ncbi:unnamed protein product, partial [Pylaiella littoralis]